MSVNRKALEHTTTLNMWRSPVSGRRSSRLGRSIGVRRGTPDPDVARKLEIGTEIPQGGPHLTHAGYQPSEAHSEIRDMLRRPLSAR
jgi:hypothetical protein